MAANLISVTLQKSITTDEIVLIPSAYYHWVDPSVNLIGQHPPLIKLLAGLPLLFLQPNEWKPETIDPARTSDQHEWGYVMHFWQDNRPNFELISFWSRLPMIALTLALGVLVFVFARDLFGPRAAVLAVSVFALEPTILAHGRIVQTDIPAAFGLLLTVYALWRYIRAPGWKNACFLGIAGATALLAKYSMLVVIPAIFVTLSVLFFLWAPRRKGVIRDVALTALLLVVTINAAYFFHNRTLTPGDLKWIVDVFPESASWFVTLVRLADGYADRPHHGDLLATASRTGRSSRRPFGNVSQPRLVVLFSGRLFSQDHHSVSPAFGSFPCLERVSCDSQPRAALAHSPPSIRSLHSFAPGEPDRYRRPVLSSSLRVSRDPFRRAS